MVGVEHGSEDAASAPRNGVTRGVAVLDFILRVVAIAATLASAIAMGTTREGLPFFNRFIRFRAKCNDLPTFTFFVAANAIVRDYLVLSLALSIFHVTKSSARGSRVVLIFFDTGMLALLAAGASAAAAVVYLAHKGNSSTNWFAICRQFRSFCERTSGSLVGSFGGVIILVLLVLMSAVALSRRSLLLLWFQERTRAWDCLGHVLLC